MNHIFHAIKKAVNLPTYNNDVQVGYYWVEQRGEWYDLSFTFLRENPKTRHKKHFGSWDLEGEVLTVYLSLSDATLPLWVEVIKKTMLAIEINGYSCKEYKISPPRH